MTEILNNQNLLGKFRDIDGTEKFVFKTNDGIIEATIIKNKPGIDVFCLPTHHYCNMGCKFCHLTEERDKTKKMVGVTAKNMLEVLNYFADTRDNNNCLISFMGVGEPFLNTALIIETFHSIREKYKNLSLALATMMPTIKPMEFFIKQVKNNLPIKIHFSLHSPIDKIRNKIIPASKVAIQDCLETLLDYKKAVLNNKILQDNLIKFHTNGSPIEIHYTLINGVNDSDEELKKLIHYGTIYQIPLKILKFNPTKSLKNSPKEQDWLKILSSEYNAPVSMYAPPGPNIGSSCGQFTKHYYLGSNSKQEIQEFEEWRKKYQVFD